MFAGRHTARAWRADDAGRPRPGLRARAGRIAIALGLGLGLSGCLLVPSGRPDVRYIPWAPVVRAVETAAATAAAAPVAIPISPSIRNHIAGPALEADVGVYTDCSGRSPIPPGVSVDRCLSILYFVGHNPGVFAPLISYGVGTVIHYWDEHGVEQSYRVVQLRDWRRADGYAPVYPGATAEFQTCLTADASVLRILDGVSIKTPA